MNIKDTFDGRKNALREPPALYLEIHFESCKCLSADYIENTPFRNARKFWKKIHETAKNSYNSEN